MQYKLKQANVSRSIILFFHIYYIELRVHFFGKNPKMDYCVRSHGFFFAKETKNPKKNFSRATTLAQRALVKCNFFESFPKETQKQRILRIRIQINPLNPRRERIHWIHNSFLNFTKETKNPFWIQNPD